MADLNKRSGSGVSVSAVNGSNTPQKIFDSAVDGRDVATLVVRLRGDSTTTGLRVFVTRLTDAPATSAGSDGATLVPGDKEYFRVATDGIQVVSVAKEDSGTAVVDWYPDVILRQ